MQVGPVLLDAVSQPEAQRLTINDDAVWVESTLGTDEKLGRRLKKSDKAPSEEHEDLSVQPKVRSQ